MASARLGHSIFYVDEAELIAILLQIIAVIAIMRTLPMLISKIFVQF